MSESERNRVLDAMIDTSVAELCVEVVEDC
jgi:hypothetical protein